MGHARALIGTADPEILAQNVVSRGLNVRQTEALARGPAKSRAPQVSQQNGSTDIEALERQLGDLLGLKVSISHGAKGGTVSIAYATLDQLDMVCQRLSGGEI
jgi:ParB family chromosome partitioning protein